MDLHCVPECELIGANEIYQLCNCGPSITYHKLGGSYTVDLRSVKNCVDESPGGNLGFPRIGVRGDVLVVSEVCKVACEHCHRVFPIRGCVFKSGGMDSQHHSALFRGLEVWFCSIGAHSLNSWWRCQSMTLSRCTAW